MAQKTFERDALLKSQAFSHIQKDFRKAILCKEFYTMAEAEKAVNEFFRRSDTHGRGDLDPGK